MAQLVGPRRQARPPAKKQSDKIQHLKCCLLHCSWCHPTINIHAFLRTTVMLIWLVTYKGDPTCLPVLSRAVTLWTCTKPYVFFPLNLCVYLCYWLQRSWFCSFPRDCFPAEICKSPQVIVHGFCSSECSLHCVSTSLLLRELLVRHFPMGRGCLVGWFSNTRLVSHLCASLGWLCNQHQSRPRLKHTVMLV